MKRSSGLRRSSPVSESQLPPQNTRAMESYCKGRADGLAVVRRMLEGEGLDDAVEVCDAVIEAAARVDAEAPASPS